MSKKQNTEGYCALTGSYGKFVKCHILPQAFTRPTTNGKPLYQSTKGEGLHRRWSSWYDKKLAVRKGEDFLSAIDDEGIKCLRKHQLVWSSWQVFRPHFESIAPMLPNHGFRQVKGLDTEALIRFAHSIAWRASASTLPDMKHATLEKTVEDGLKEYVLGKPLEGPSLYPVSLTQISTVGEAHNQSPYIDIKPIPNLGEDIDLNISIMRIYLDGLVLHIHLPPIPADHLTSNPVFLGSADYVLITSVTYEVSFQYENLLHLLRECHPSLLGNR